MPHEALDQLPHTICTDNPNSLTALVFGRDPDSFSFTYEQTIRTLPDLSLTIEEFHTIRGRKAVNLAWQVLRKLIDEDIDHDEELIRAYRRSLK